MSFGPAMPTAGIIFIKAALYHGFLRGGEEVTPAVHAADSTLLITYFGIRLGSTVNEMVACTPVYSNAVHIQLVYSLDSTRYM